jgi:serine/threonine-protein phosphatase 2A regulatory subunit A
LALGEELGGLVDLVGGKDYAHVLLGPLESLAGVEETVVRDRAVESINRIAAVIPDATFESALVPLIKRLSNGSLRSIEISPRCFRRPLSNLLPFQLTHILLCGFVFAHEK